VQDFSEETHWEKAAKTRMGRYLTKIETDFILKAVNLAECTFVMDVGAEAGRFSLLAAGSNTCVIGIDIDSYGLRRLKLKNKLVNVIQADVRKIPLRENLLEAILMIEVLDYIPELEMTLKECYRTLKPEGSLILSFGNNSSLKSKLRKLRGKSYLHSYRKVIQGLDKTEFKTGKKVGYNWLPFNRTSESDFIPLLAKIEKLFGLRGVPNLSPWVLIHGVKPK
jgi:ubiquinone/menaquinone biosynthesis C-methylase UbiE